MCACGIAKLSLMFIAHFAFNLMGNLEIYTYLLANDLVCSANEFCLGRLMRCQFNCYASELRKWMKMQKEAMKRRRERRRIVKAEIEVNFESEWVSEWVCKLRTLRNFNQVNVSFNLTKKWKTSQHARTKLTHTDRVQNVNTSKS